MADQPSERERPRAEPEIIPPGAPLRRPRDDFTGAQFTQRIYVTRLGPFGLILLALALGVIAVVLLVLLVGAVLFWIPVIGLLVAAAIFSGALRSRFRRER